MEHIVVTTDFSSCAERAFATAREWYERLPGPRSLTLLSVIEDVVPVGIQFEFAITTFDHSGVMQEAEKQAKKKLAEIAAVHFAGLNVEQVTVRALTSAPNEIVSFLRSSDATLAIMSTHGRSGVEHLVLGSVVEKVLRKAPCPVLVVPGATRKADH